MSNCFGEAGCVAVLPQRCGPLSPGSIPGGAVCAFGFQSKLAASLDWKPNAHTYTAFRRFFSGYSGFPPAPRN